MKNKLSLLGIMFLLFISCNKNDPAQEIITPEKKFALTFSINDFTQSIEDLDDKSRINSGKTLRTPADSLKKHINHLYLAIYNATTRKKVKIIYQHSGQPAFGVIKDSLPQGRYIMSLIGAKDDILLRPAPFSSDTDMVYIEMPGTDVFYKFMDQVNVNGEVNQIVKIERIVARIKVNIQDRIPFDVNSIIFSPEYKFPGATYGGIPKAFDLKTGRSDFDRFTPIYGNYNVLIPDSLKGTKNFNQEFYLLIVPDITQMHLRIYSKDNKETILADKTVYGVGITAGKRTILSGNLFGGQPSDSGLIVDLGNTGWSDNQPISF